MPSSTASATVTTTTKSVEYSPSVPTTAFNFSFPVLDKSHLKVTKTTIATGVAVVLTSGTDYSVSLTTGGGTVNTVSSVSNTHRLKIDRVVPLTQPTSFRTQGSFRAETHENAFDRLTMQIQQVATGAQVDAGVAAAIAAHAALADPHVGYALLAGRSGGQHLKGGTGASENLQLSSTANATKGKILIGNAGTSAFDDVNLRLGIGTAAPAYPLEIVGDAMLASVLLSGGNVYKTATGGVTGLFADPSATANKAAVAVYGTTHATFPTQVQLLCSTCGIYSNTGTLRWTFNSTGLFGAAGLDIDILGDLFVTTDTGYDIELDSWTLGQQSSANDAEFAVYSSSVWGTIANSAGINIYGDAHATKSGDIDVIGDLILLRDNWGTTESSALVAIDSNGVRIKTGALQQWMHETQTAAIAETFLAPDDCGDVIWVTTDATVIQLPDAAAANKGCEFTVIATAADAAAGFSISPHASDGIFGTCIGVGGVAYEFTGTVNKDVLVAIGDQNKGDTVTMVSDGTGFWYTTACYGLLTSQP